MKHTIILFLAGCIYFSGICVIGQDAVSPTAEIPAPESEEFSANTDAMVPWRKRGHECNGVIRFEDPDCPKVSPKDFQSRSVLSIYESDGSLWHRFNLNECYANPNSGFKKDGFFPYSPRDGFDCFTRAVVLRIVGESENWYKVEINEDTQETRYISKSDNNWARVGWYRFFNSSRWITYDRSNLDLRDSPNGKVIERNPRVFPQRILFEKLDGDWMQVQFRTGFEPNISIQFAWIRWRNGNDILIGFRLNDWKVPSKSGKE